MIFICDNGLPYNIRKYKLVLLIPLFILIILCFYNGSEFYKQGIFSKVENGTDMHGPKYKETLSEILNITQIIYEKAQRLDTNVQNMDEQIQLIDTHSQTNKQIYSEILNDTQIIYKKVQSLDRKVRDLDGEVQRLVEINKEAKVQSTVTNNQTNKQTKVNETNTHNVTNKQLLNVTQIMDENIQKYSKCYEDRIFDKKLGLFKLSDILLSKRKPKKDKTIFFHETACSKNGKLRLNARQACAIESAALLNPNFDIFVLFASPIARSQQDETEGSLDILSALSDYKNIYLRNVNLWRYTRHTPIQNWFYEGHLLKSHHIKEHLSEFLRYVTLWHWGGTCLEFDIMLKQTLENITTNFIGLQEESIINSEVINLSYKDFGHKIANLFLKYVEEQYDPHDGGIDSYFVTDIFKEICKTDNIELMTPERCSGFQIFDKKYFHPIPYYSWQLIFNENDLVEAMMLTNKSIAIHLWEELSENATVKVDSKVAYTTYAEKYCPEVYNSCGKFI